MLRLRHACLRRRCCCHVWCFLRIDYFSWYMPRYAFDAAARCYTYKRINFIRCYLHICCFTPCYFIRHAIDDITLMPLWYIMMPLRYAICYATPDYIFSLLLLFAFFAAAEKRLLFAATGHEMLLDIYGALFSAWWRLLIRSFLLLLLLLTPCHAGWFSPLRLRLYCRHAAWAFDSCLPRAAMLPRWRAVKSQVTIWRPSHGLYAATLFSLIFILLLFDVFTLICCYFSLRWCHAYRLIFHTNAAYAAFYAALLRHAPLSLIALTPLYAYATLFAPVYTYTIRYVYAIIVFAIFLMPALPMICWLYTPYYFDALFLRYFIRCCLFCWVSIFYFLACSPCRLFTRYALMLITYARYY